MSKATSSERARETLHLRNGKGTLTIFQSVGCDACLSTHQALAPYAKQANDDSLWQMATRIQMRASRRCGELLAAIAPHPGGRPKTRDANGPSFSRARAAFDAGLSERQRKTALRVAAVPQAEFEEVIEIRLRAERKAGELLIEMQVNGERAKKGGDQRSTDMMSVDRLRHLDITHKQSSRWQEIARIPLKFFESYIAAALASYAKQANDDSLWQMATRIQMRASRRCGELLAAIPPAKNQHVVARGSAPPSRTQAAREAGLSRDQKRTALRVAAVPEAASRCEQPGSLVVITPSAKADGFSGHA